jgi:hypothetical protein
MLYCAGQRSLLQVIIKYHFWERQTQAGDDITITTVILNKDLTRQS